MNQKNIFMAAVALLLVAFMVGGYFYQNQQSEQTTQTAAQRQEALARAHAPTLGPAKAPVHIVEFLDPACETCRAFYPFVKDLMAANPDKIRLSVRYAPFHRGSDQVVKVLEAARKQDKFWQTLEALLASQAVWVIQHTANVDLVWQPLSGLGLDIERLKSDMNSPEIARVIAQDLADATTLNVAQTPEFFVNGQGLPRFGYGELKKLVDDAVASAK